MTKLKIGWRSLEPPRPPVGVLAEGRSASALAEAVRRLVATGVQLKAAVGERTLLVLGDSDELPWADRASYLGREQGLLLPATLEPTVPVDLLGQAIRQVVAARYPGGPIQVAALPGRLVVFDVSEGPVDSDRLVEHARRWFA